MVILLKLVDWTNVTLLIFPHGAILSFELDWMPKGKIEEIFALSDLRAWVYLSKFRHIKIGVTRGWTFGEKKQIPLDEAQDEKKLLGSKLFNAIYGDSSIALANVANWLIMMPWEKIDNITVRRVRLRDYCHHHTCAVVDNPPNDEALQELAFHISRQYGSINRPSRPDDAYLARYTRDQVLKPRANRLIRIAREGVFALQWGNGRTFMKQMMTVYAILSRHCLSERVILEKLSYLAALRSQNLPSPGERSSMSISEKDQIRRELMELATMLVKYRSSMASDDCGGRSEFREFFQTVRRTYQVADLKQELREPG